MSYLKDLETISKGIAHKHRLNALFLLSKENLTLEEISERLETDYKNTCQHVQKMHRAKLVDKKYIGHKVVHSITKRGNLFLEFYRTIDL